MKARYLVACAFLALIWHHICLNLREAVDFIKSVYAGVVIGPDHQPILLDLEQWQRGLATEVRLHGVQSTALTGRLHPAIQSQPQGTPLTLLQG